MFFLRGSTHDFSSSGRSERLTYPRIRDHSRTLCKASLHQLRLGREHSHPLPLSRRRIISTADPAIPRQHKPRRLCSPSALVATCDRS
jgi:hypothetical protein